MNISNTSWLPPCCLPPFSLNQPALLSVTLTHISFSVGWQDESSMFVKWGYPQIIHFNGIVRYKPFKPSIWGYPHLWKPQVVVPEQVWSKTEMGTSLGHGGWLRRLLHGDPRNFQQVLPLPAWGRLNGVYPLVMTNIAIEYPIYSWFTYSKNGGSFYSDVTRG